MLSGICYSLKKVIFKLTLSLLPILMLEVNLIAQEDILSLGAEWTDDGTSTFPIDFSSRYFEDHCEHSKRSGKSKIEYKGSYGRRANEILWLSGKPISFLSSEDFFVRCGNNFCYEDELIRDEARGQKNQSPERDLSDLQENGLKRSFEVLQYRGQEKQRANFSDEELRFSHWDCSMRSLIPGKGPDLPIDSSERWQWQWLPEGVLYRAYFASNRESRLAIHFVHEDKLSKDYWDPTLGGRFPVIRYGNFSRLYPEGLQFDLEAAVIGRLTLDRIRDLYSSDYRFGAPLTFRKGPMEYKLGYYHISSHMGDEQVVNVYKETGQVYRINYSRDCLMFGIAWRPDANWRFYWGGDYAFRIDGGARPWQLEMGAEYSPILLPGFRGSPFAAVHLKWNEETDWDTYTAFEFGWQWKTIYQHTMRTGLYLMQGYADQYQFYNRREKQIGYGFWLDF